MPGRTRPRPKGRSTSPTNGRRRAVGHVIVDLPVGGGLLAQRSGHSHQAFFKEGFIDECAAAAKADPVAFRAALLQGHPRHRAVLQKVADISGWGTAPLPGPDGARRARGVALHQSFGSIVAQVAEVSVSPADKSIRVHRIVAAIDCGLVVNPAGVRQQMESAIVYGLGAALHGEITLRDGRVEQSNFNDYPVPRMHECPKIETVLMQNLEPPEGVGEPGTPPVAPAVANALFALTGQRLRSLPLRLA
jgi:isoquinoline 1-oxidoreductase beta subunit